ncbi:MAG: hypothetical protein V7K98_19500 [Nostoc sp.]|uniref:hypothetical protein n=1 Tax=Nostoc sp. TaxID=1180 RepID=UPI002FF91826
MSNTNDLTSPSPKELADSLIQELRYLGITLDLQACNFIYDKIISSENPEIAYAELRLEMLTEFKRLSAQGSAIGAWLGCFGLLIVTSILLSIFGQISNFFRPAQNTPLTSECIENNSLNGKNLCGH